MTPREKFITALEGGQAPGRVPHFELVFYLTMEAFGRIHPTHQRFEQWAQMSPREKDLHRRNVAELYIRTARTYEHSAIFFHTPLGWDDEEIMRGFELIRELAGMDYFLMVGNDGTFAIPSGDEMMPFIERVADEPQKVKDEAAALVDTAIERAQRFVDHGAVEGFAMCADYCFNDGPFLSPAMFDEFVTPYLARLIAAYRDMDVYAIKHTDGNIMPILDSLVSTRPHALHSLDPQGGVDIAEVKRRAGDKLCLIGNVNCALMDTGTDEQVVESARYALRHGMPGGGYIFSTSNCIYSGMDLRRYDLMLDVWRREGNYPTGDK